MDTSELKRFAQIGAQARLQELDQEREQILKAFPTLRTTSTAPSRPNGWTPAKRKAASLRMKRYWAKRRKRQ
jgi:hypothetical protein